MRPFDDVDLHAFYDNQLGPSRRETIAAFLKNRPADAERIARWHRQADAVRAEFAGITREPVPLWLTVNQIEGFRSKPASVAKLTQRSPQRPRPAAPTRAARWKGSAPLALTLCLVFGAGLCLPYAVAQWPIAQKLQVWPPTTRLDEAFEARALDAHNTFSTDAERPIEVADVPGGALKRWLERRVPFSVVVPDIKNEGWTLRGGRIAPADHGPGALLVYENALGDRLSLFSGRITAADRGQNSEPSLGDRGVLSWTEGPVGYAIVTSRSPGWLARNADRLYSAVHGAPAT
jgi:anti-sigma factor RsiW